MNIAVIYGQKHKGNTWALTQLFLKRLTDKYTDITEFFLPDDGIGYCVGCCNCFFQGEDRCPHAAAVRKIAAALDAADLIVIASPCYVFGVTGQLKALFDHFGYRFMAHRPEAAMFRKQALALSTAAGLGMNKTAKAIAFNLSMWGVPRIYRFGLRIGAADFDHIPEKRKRRLAREIEPLARKILNKHGRAKAGIKTRFLFAIMRMRQKQQSDWNLADRAYWEARGWLGKARPF